MNGAPQPNGSEGPRPQDTVPADAQATTRIEVEENPATVVIELPEDGHGDDSRG